TFNESGVKGYEASNWFGLMAPIKVSKDIINKVNTDVNKALAMKDVRERFDRDGLITKGGATEDFGRFIRAETEKYANVIKKAGIKQLGSAHTGRRRRPGVRHLTREECHEQLVTLACSRSRRINRRNCRRPGLVPVAQCRDRRRFR